MKTLQRFIRAQWVTTLGAGIGALAGLLYWKLIGCQSGPCAITSSAVNSTVYGSVLGGLLFSSFKKSISVAQ